MSTTTTRNSLVKPGYADAADIAVINTNMDTIDASFAKCNWAATAAPAVTDDSGDGYAVGSVWLDVTNNNIYVAKSVSVGAAVWTKQAAHNNYSATGAPTVNDDLDLHYAPGSMWVDTTNHNVYVCESAANGAAVWKQVNSATGVILANGTVPLTADWDVGAYHITADHFVSDVAIGTAPYQTTSTTVNTNLNADLLDGIQSTGFAILAGQSGGQTLNGGTGASDGLTLSSTTHGTKGSIVFPDANLVVGTKATTATASAISIHEGAAAASNKIVFLDGDGTTTNASLYKGTTDNMVITAGSNDAYLSSASPGVFTCNGGFSVTKTATDLSSSAYAYAATHRPTFTSDQTTTNHTIYSACFPEVRTGKTNSGNVYSFYTETMRNHNGAATDDGGTLAGLYAQQAFFGHYNLHADEAPLTTYAAGIRISPYAVTGTISNLFAIEVSATSTGGTVTAPWWLYSANTGNGYIAGTYNRFQTTSGDRVIYVVQTSTTDPIADAWNTHSNSKYKDLVDDLDTKEKRAAHKADFKTIPLRKWKRKTQLDDEHYKGMFPLEDDRPRGPEGDQKPAKDLEVRQAEQDLAIYRHIEKCKTLKKFTVPHTGMFAEDAPEEIISFGLNGEREGIDLGAYIGWLHGIVLGQQDEIDDLKATLDSVLTRLDKLEKKIV